MLGAPPPRSMERKTLLRMLRRAGRAPSVRPLISAPRKRRVPRRMKGACSVKRQTESEVPCVMPRGVQQKRDQNALRCKRRAAKRRAERAANPDVAPLGGGEAEPLDLWRRQHAPGRADGRTGALLRGSRDGTSRRERVERGRPRSGRVATANSPPQAASQGGEPERGVGWAHSTDEGSESRWREGTLLESVTPEGKEWRLWQH